MARIRRRLITLTFLASGAAAVAVVRKKRLAAATEEFTRRYGAN
jgi:hypothetical protein